MNLIQSQRLSINIVLVTFFTTLLLASCHSFNKDKTEIAINKYVHHNFQHPKSFKITQFHEPLYTKVSTNPQDRTNTLQAQNDTIMVNGWAIAVNISAVTRHGTEQNQAAAFYLNASCDSVIFSDIAPIFMKHDSLSIFGHL
jgi:hypothetical protein